MKLSFINRFFYITIVLAVAGQILNAKSLPRNPNVILILADDCGYELFSAYGGESHTTPVLDSLAEDGLTFNYTFAAPLCTPTRIALMTGQYNHRNYKTFGQFPLDFTDKTFGNLMQDAGYATCFAGKWQLGDPGLIEPMGFDQTMQNDSWGGFWSQDTIWVNGEETIPEKGTYRPDVTCDFVLDFVEANQDRPFFVYYPMFLIHHPEEPTPDYPDQELLDFYKAGGRYTRSDPERMKVEAAIFADMVTYMDKLIGRVVDKVDALGLREDTIIMFLGDNGTCYHEAIVHGKPFLGTKGTMTDGGTRVPLIVNWKGQTQGGHTDDLVDVTDFMPTFADIAQETVPAEAALDGVSFLPQLKGETGTPRAWAFMPFDRDGTVAWRIARDRGTEPEHPQGVFWSRTQRWKLYGSGELYDLEKDPLEKNAILVESDNELTATMRDHLESAFRELDIKQEDMITYDEWLAANPE